MADEFATTRWSLVLSAAQTQERVREALEWLCEVYWRPLYSYLRRRGYRPEDARDLVQGFFVEVLEGNMLQRIDPREGRLRAYMLGALKHYLSHQRDRDEAQKRRADQPRHHLSLDDAEQVFTREADPESDPSVAYDRRWALAVFDRAMVALREEYERTGKGKVFERLRGYLNGDDESSYSAAAGALGMTEGATKVAVHRMRSRLGQFLRDEVAQTVARPEEVDEELRYLLRVL